MQVTHQEPAYNLGVNSSERRALTMLKHLNIHNQILALYAAIKSFGVTEH